VFNCVKWAVVGRDILSFLGLFLRLLLLFILVGGSLFALSCGGLLWHKGVIVGVDYNVASFERASHMLGLEGDDLVLLLLECLGLVLSLRERDGECLFEKFVEGAICVGLGDFENVFRFSKNAPAFGEAVDLGPIEEILGLRSTF